MTNLSTADWRTWSGNTTEPNSAMVSAAISAAEQAINDHCARKFFVAGATATARVYVPGVGTTVRIHDCVEVTAVADDTITVASTAYQLEPLNGITDAGLAVPYEQIRRLSGNGWTHDYGRATVSVTARWGWSALPAQYTEATKMLTTDLLNMKDIRGGVAGFGEFGAVRIRENPMVTYLLSGLVRTVEKFGMG